MILFGSEAIRHYFPGFRRSKDLDLAASAEEMADLAARLERADVPCKPHHAVFRHRGRMVEVLDWAHSDLWREAVERLRFERRLVLEGIGSVVLPPPALLLFAKLGGLAYPVHWHKNLADYHFLRGRMGAVPAEVAPFARISMDWSRSMFGAWHARITAAEAFACHPKLRSQRDFSLHDRLHERLAAGATPACRRAGAWRGFPDVAEPQRTELMRQLLAEEAMVMAAERHLVPHEEDEEQRPDERRLRDWALRSLATGSLPESWRYFTAVRYPEIVALVRDGFLQSVSNLQRYRHPHA